MTHVMIERAKLEQVLEALEGMDILFSPLARDCTQYIVIGRAREAITAIKQALAAPVQEPVAWGWRYDSCGHAVVNRLAITETPEPKETDFSRTLRLYDEAVDRLSPAAQRQWVGLTRMELIKCGVLPFGMSYELCQAIEAKLKEKNSE